MGELIARAVYDGVTEALHRQNGYTAGRSVFRRLTERGMDLFALLDAAACDCIENKGRALVEVVLVPRYAAFLEGAFALSDDYEKGLVSDLTVFQDRCREIAAELSGDPERPLTPLVSNGSAPKVLEEALNALLNGIAGRNR